MKHLGLRAIALSMLIASAAACTTQSSSTTTSGTDSAASAIPAGVTVATDNSGLEGPPTQNADTTLAYMKTIKFGDTTKVDSAFKFPYDCPGCKKAQVELWIVPEKKAYKIDWPTAFVNRENKGWIVAEVINADTVRYDPLDLNPGEIAYQWVGPINNDGSDRAVAYYKINATSGVSSTVMSPVRSVTYCNAANWKHRTQSAAKQEHPPGESCQVITYPHGVTASGGPLFPPNGTWISCVGGCCQVQNGNMKTTQTKGK